MPSTRAAIQREPVPRSWKAPQIVPRRSRRRQAVAATTPLSARAAARSVKRTEKGCAGIRDRPPAQSVPAVDRRTGRRAIPEAGPGDRQPRRPEAAFAIEYQASGRQHHARSRQVELDSVERISRLGKAVGRGRDRAENRSLDLGEFRVDVLVEVQDVPYCGDHQQRQNQPGPSSSQLESLSKAARPGIHAHASLPMEVDRRSVHDEMATRAIQATRASGASQKK